ncbi:MAG TPA: CysB family HTH-type transcriptional regulator [Hyphomicrobiaceae bacterium]|nr:CysB family HTH-type transcriptional regulator [Hyphomicrobiaceae bacterium]
MNFQQLRIVRETVRRNFNLTEVANSLFTSQSGVSKHIKDLEDELGVELFVRRGKRLLGLTDPGKEMVEIVDRVLTDTANIKRLAEQFSNREQGKLVIATTHTQARYVLPHVVAAFRNAYPRVHLTLHQGSPAEIESMLAGGTADIGICTEALHSMLSFAAFPFYSWHHGVVIPKGHPLDQAGTLTLEALAEWPIITYHEGFTGRGTIDRAFADAGLTPDIVVSAMDADVLKAYVELGLGVGIIAAMAFSSKRDTGLRLLDSGHLFAPNTTMIALRRGSYLRTYAYRFIELCSPALPESVVKAAVLADAQASGPEAKAELTGKAEAQPGPGLPRRTPPAQDAAERPTQLWRSSGNTLSRDEVKRTA